ncbi:hypothetical protein CBR_g10903 [Chara braunii]|uniref:GT34-family glycosyltransferase n=1 Tax=Chara braunii TaxID=69332 RepID=A0A388KPJ3_CHABU|nr:hypothetical protein CBR_g10903 [Chara braunii]|eukprot:GBG71966.1 hypothetical protein CBR_g10903 [Chara braunii]
MMRDLESEGKDGILPWIQSLPGKVLIMFGEHPRLKQQAAMGMGINLFFIIMMILANSGQDVTRFVKSPRARMRQKWEKLGSLAEMNVSVALTDGRPLDKMLSLELAANSKPSVLLVTSIPPKCETPEGDEAMLRSIKNKMDYARLHGMETWFSMEAPEPDGKVVWNKYAVLRRVMQGRPNFDWYFWIDHDSLIVDLTFQIPWDSYKDHSLVMWGEESIAVKPEFTAVNTGVLFLRNDKFSRDLLDHLLQFWTLKPEAEMRQEMAQVVKGFSDNLTAQGAMAYVLATESKQWLPQIHFELMYHINRYWKDEMENLEDYYTSWKGDGKSPPFIITYVGCQLCWKPNDQFEMCTRELDRAFNFADDQVLSVLNLKHRDLQSSDIVKLNARKLDANASGIWTMQPPQ